MHPLPAGQLSGNGLKDLRSISLDTAICFVTKLLCTSDGYRVVILEGCLQQRMEYLSQNDDFQHEFHVFHLKSHAESFILCA